MCAHFCKWIQQIESSFEFSLCFLLFVISLCCEFSYEILFSSYFVLFIIHFNLFIVWFTFIVPKSFLNCDINFLWYRIPFLSFLLNNTCRKIKKKISIFFSDVTWTSFWISIHFFIYVFLHIYFFCYIYIFNFMFRNFAFFLGNKIQKNVVIFIMPFENICFHTYIYIS